MAAPAKTEKPKSESSGPVDESSLTPADLKIILLGDSAVGKSKLVERFLMNDYEPRQLSTYALTVFRYNSEVDGKKVSIDFWDTAGQERFSSMHPSYYYRAHACVLVFDATRKVTYQNLTEWYKELQQHRKGIPTLLVCNKIDVDYAVTKKTFAFAEKHSLPFYFCSAADGTNVVKTFTDAISAGHKFKIAPSVDIEEEVLRTLDYFDAKEKSEKDTKDKGDKEAKESKEKSSTTAPAKDAKPAPKA